MMMMILAEVTSLNRRSVRRVSDISAHSSSWNPIGMHHIDVKFAARNSLRELDLVSVVLSVLLRIVYIKLILNCRMVKTGRILGVYSLLA